MGNTDRRSFTPEQLKELDKLERREKVSAAVETARGSLLPLAYLTVLAILLSLGHVELQYVIAAFLIIHGIPALTVNLKSKG